MATGVGDTVTVHCNGQGTRNELVGAYGAEGFQLMDERGAMLTTGHGINRVTRSVIELTSTRVDPVGSLAGRVDRIIFR